MRLSAIKVLLLHYILFLFYMGSKFEGPIFLGGRFAEGRFGKGPICPTPSGLVGLASNHRLSPLGDSHK